MIDIRAIGKFGLVVIILALVGCGGGGTPDNYLPGHQETSSVSLRSVTLNEIDIVGSHASSMYLLDSGGGKILWLENYIEKEYKNPTYKIQLFKRKNSGLKELKHSFRNDAKLTAIAPDKKIYLRGNYIPDWADGMDITARYDISDIEQPKFLGAPGSYERTYADISFSSDNTLAISGNMLFDPKTFGVIKDLDITHRLFSTFNNFDTQGFLTKNLIWSSNKYFAIADISDIDYVKVLGIREFSEKTHHAAISPDKKYAYVLENYFGVKVLDISNPKSTLPLVAKIEIDQPRAMALSPDGKRLYTWQVESIFVYDVSDVKNPKKIKEIDCDGFSPDKLKISEDGKTGYLLAQKTATKFMYDGAKIFVIKL